MGNQIVDEFHSIFSMMTESIYNINRPDAMHLLQDYAFCQTYFILLSSF